ncbi:hypothetical protein AB0M94_36245 [Streptomyces xanthochromogenes]|uniref:hypothetical protein n=1 Tax=Streptomyces xanthochromogenes TaxID=67384 RepID=UPI00344767CE
MAHETVRRLTLARPVRETSSLRLETLVDTVESWLALNRGARAFERITSVPGISEAFARDFGPYGSAATEAQRPRWTCTPMCAGWNARKPCSGT